MKRSRSWLRHRNGQRDATHAVIVTGLRQLGYYVIELTGAGGGVPDIVVYSRRSDAPVWLELKSAKGKLRESQVAWRDAAVARGLRVATARSLDEALAALIGIQAARVNAMARTVTGVAR